MTLELTVILGGDTKRDVVLRFRGVDAVVCCKFDCVQLKTGVEYVIRYFVTGDAVYFEKNLNNIQ